MAVAAAERGRNPGHSRGILRVQDAKNEGEGMATNSQLQYSHFPVSKFVRHYLKFRRNLRKFCSSAAQVYILSVVFGVFLAVSAFAQTRELKCLCREGEIGPRANFQNILKKKNFFEKLTFFKFVDGHLQVGEGGARNESLETSEEIQGIEWDQDFPIPQIKR